MKKISGILVAVLVLGMTLPAFAQQQAATSQEETVVMKKSDLTPDQLTKVQKDEIKQKLGQYSEYAEMGRGIGLAVGESLKGVKDVAVDFSRTEVGKFTLFLIAWKVMAKDVIDTGDKIVGYLLGFPIFFIGGMVLIWSYRRQCLPRRVLVRHTKEGGKEWAIIAPNGEKVDISDGSTKPYYVEGRSAWAVGHVIVGILFFILVSALTFGC